MNHAFPNPLLKEIYSTRQVVDANGNRYQLRDEVDQKEGSLLHSLVLQHRFTKSLEVGCAFGISSLYICDALSRLDSPSHTIIDPFQEADGHGVGVANLRRANFNFFELIEKPSELVLPGLLAEGKSYQFAFIDGWHTFDHTLLDFFYINRLLEEGGIVVIDDVNMPAIRRVVRYILNYPNYKLAATTENARPHTSFKRRVIDTIVASLASVLPQSYKNDVFTPQWRQSDYSAGVNCTMVALQKVGPDNRKWNWYERF